MATRTVQCIVQLGLLRTETTQCAILVSSDMQPTNCIGQFLRPTGHYLKELRNASLEVSSLLELCNFWREGRAFTSGNVQC